MRFLRYFVLVFGMMVLLTGTVLAVGHQQSADGLWKIAYTYYEYEDDDYRWYLVEVLPTGNGIETPTTVSNYLIWSPNHEWVVFHSTEPTDGIYLARPDGSQRRLLIDESSRYGYSHLDTISWSPDSEWIYYADIIVGVNYDLFRMNIADGTIETYGFRGGICCVQWSADGEWMLVRRSYIDGQYGIVRLRPDGSDQLILFKTTDATRFHNNHNVTSIGFVDDDEWVILRVSDGSDVDSIYRIRANGMDMQLITTVSDVVSWMFLSPDGENIVYYDLRNQPSRLMSLRLNDPRAETLVEDDDLVFDMPLLDTFSPDGKRMFFSLYEPTIEKLHLYQLDLDTGEISYVYKRQPNYLFSPHFLPVTFEDGDSWWWIVGVGVIVFSSIILIRR